MTTEKCMSLLRNGCFDRNWGGLAEELAAIPGVATALVSWQSGSAIGESRTWRAAPATSSNTEGSQDFGWLVREGRFGDAMLTVSILPAHHKTCKDLLSNVLDAVGSGLDVAAHDAHCVHAAVRKVAIQSVIVGRHRAEHVVDAELRLVEANEPARRILVAGEPIVAGANGKLQFPKVVQQDLLQSHVRRVVTSAQPEPGLIVVRNSENQIDCLVVITRFPDIDPPVASQLAILSWVQLRDLPPLSDLTLKSAFELSRSEAALANALAAGKSVTSFAKDVDREVATIRWHLHNALQHAGVSSQGELIRLILAVQLLMR